MPSEDGFVSGSAVLHYRSVNLLPVQPAMLTWLREQELSAELALRWRHHGLHPSPAEFEQTIWTALCNFVVQIREESPVGIVSAYDYDSFNQHCKIAAAKFGSKGGMAVIRGTMLLVDYVFAAWPLRKVYFESADYNAHQFASSPPAELVHEGSLNDHVFLDGAYHNLNIYSLTREGWTSARRRFFR